jgi:hypothetical protein
MKRGMKDLYRYNDSKYKNNDIVDQFQFLDFNNVTLDMLNSGNQSDLKKRINKIFYYYLKYADRELFNHLCDKVEPYLFMFRWLLCMLNRELSIKNIINVWDCIFAFEYLDSKAGNITHINFLDFMCIAMILNIKIDLIQEEDSCYMLSSLMHYPTEIDIKDLIQNAILYREIIINKIKIIKSMS